ncbi:MAG: acetate--CoA ligase family protein, partial [Pigmentiphaga sp.]
MPRPSLAPLLDSRSLILLTSRHAAPLVAPPVRLAGRVTHVVLHDAATHGAHLAGIEPGQRPDLAQVAVASHELPEALRLLARWRPRAVIVHALAPAALDLREWARQHDCWLLGPHSFGLQRPPGGLNASRHPTLAARGRVAIIVQSAALTAAVMDWADDTRMAFSAVVSLGDSATVGVDDLLDFFAFDPHTDSIALYLDDPGPARPFMSALRGAARVKPVVVLKAGRRLPALPGAEAAPDPVFDAALRRAGALRVRFFLQLFSTLKALGQGQRPRGSRLALLANGQGPVDLVLDGLAVSQALRLATLSAETRGQLSLLLSPHASRANPVIEPAPLAPANFRQTIERMLDDPGVDALLVMLTPDPASDLEAFADILIDLVPQRRKPLVVCLMGDASMRRLRGRLAQAHVPAFRTPETAADAFAQLVRFHANQQLLLQTQPAQSLVSPPAVDSWKARLQAALGAGARELPPALVRELLATYGIMEHEGSPAPGTVIAARAHIFRDANFGAVISVRPAGRWPAVRSDSLELLPLNGFLVRRLLERNPLWRLALASEVSAPALEQFEQQLLRLAALAVAHPELSTLTLDPILITDRQSLILGSELILAGPDPIVLPGAAIAPHLAIAPYPVRWRRHHRFADDTPWTLRAIRPEDAEALQRFVRGLSTETRYMRFVSSLRELPAPMLARYTQIDYDREVALVATVEM